MKSGSTAIITKILRLPNLIILLTIIIGLLSSFGFIDNYVPSGKITTGLVTLIALQLLVDRLGILSSIHEKVTKKNSGYFVQLKPRTDPSFLDFPHFAKSAKEVFVVGVDLGYLATSGTAFVQESLKRGVKFKLLIVNPKIDGFFKDVINNHDERNKLSEEKVVHEHISAANESLEMMTKLVDSSTYPGKLEIRVRVDIPNPTLTMIDPDSFHGQIRVELKPYKRNHGEVPYFILDKNNPWAYELYKEHYYNKLWNDSIKLFESKPYMPKIKKSK